MPGVISLLDESHSRKIKEIRRQLDAKLNVQTPMENHYPHFSYQVADWYDDEKLAPILEELSQDRESFTVHTNGIGVFTDSEPLIVYLPVIRDAHLSQFHQQVWDRAKDVAVDLQDYYHPELWTPHITIAPVKTHDLYPVMNLLSEYSFRWNVDVDNLATIRGGVPNRRIEHRAELDDADADR